MVFPKTTQITFQKISSDASSGTLYIFNNSEKGTSDSITCIQGACTIENLS